MRSIVVVALKRDFREGDPRNPGDCAFARAINRALRARGLLCESLVGSHRVAFYREHGTAFPTHFCELQLPIEARLIIFDFDRTSGLNPRPEMGPYVFRLDIPDELAALLTWPEPRGCYRPAVERQREATAVPCEVAAC